MIALLFLLAVIFALALVFSYLAENPGSVTLTWDGTVVEVGLITAIAATIALIAAVMLVWWVLKGIVRAPGAIVDQRRGRTRDKGYRALSEGMMALGAGDVARARELARQADKRLGHTREPMVLLLEAQTCMAEGRHDDARGLFDEMLEMKETRPLALRGLFLEAQREGEHAAARHYAERAAALSPHHLWATDATIEYATLDGDYDRALEIVDDQERTKSVEKAEATRKRAVLLTAKAMGEVEENPTAARDHARQAHKLDPTLVPATITEARAHIRLDERRKASSCLTDTWRRTTHPEIADLYCNVQPGASAATRLSRARELEAMRGGDVEALLALANAALDANDYDLAREKATEALRAEPREGAFLLLADIEEASGGNPSRVRHWLQSALRAPRDPAWVADGYVSETWAPVSPVTGRFDAFEWRAPAREIGGPAIDADEALRALPPATQGPRGAPPSRADDVDDAEVLPDVLTLEPEAAHARIGDDAEEAGMVEMDAPSRAVRPGAADDDAVTVMTGARTVEVGGTGAGAVGPSPAPGAPPPAPRSPAPRSPVPLPRAAGTPNGLSGDDALARAVTTPPGGGGSGSASRLASTPSNAPGRGVGRGGGEESGNEGGRENGGVGGKAGAETGGDVLARGVSRRHGLMTAATDGSGGGEERVVQTGPSRELKGVDLKSRTVTRRPERAPTPARGPDDATAGDATVGDAMAGDGSVTGDASTTGTGAEASVATVTPVPATAPAPVAAPRIADRSADERSPATTATRTAATGATARPEPVTRSDGPKRFRLQ